MPYVKIKDGKIQARKLEYNVADHCNLSCKECSHYSPYVSANSLPFDVFERDLIRLSEVYRVERFRFLGGEPLLNRNLLDYINAVKKSGISNKIEIATNGLLLDKIPKELISLVDSISVSWYPHNYKDSDYLNKCRKICKELGTEIEVE